MRYGCHRERARPWVSFAMTWLFAFGAAGCHGAEREPVGASIAPPPAPAIESPDASVVDPSPSATPAATARRSGSFANTDPSDDQVVGPPLEVADCDEQLVAAGIAFRAARMPVHTESKMVCGAPQVVTYVSGPGHVTYEPAPLVTCTMALALASFERILQEEARRIFDSPVARIQQLGTYSCRGIAAYKGVVSEHSYANAIDLARFTLKNGKVLTVLNDFDIGDAPPARPAGAFLRVVSQRAFDEDVFSNVLTPFWNDFH